MKRLTAIRSALPLALGYRANGIWLLPDDLRPTYDESVKEIDVAQLHFSSDIEKNVVWRTLVDGRYLPDSYYRFLQDWHQVRRNAVDFANALTEVLDNVLCGRRLRVGSLDQAMRSLAKSLTSLPDPPARTPEPLASELRREAKSWASSYQNFLIQSCEALNNQGDVNQRHLIVVNFETALRTLAKARGAFGKLLQTVPDYFGSARLTVEEDAAYEAIDLRLYAWITDRPGSQIDSVPSFTRGRRKMDEQSRLARLRHCLTEVLSARGIEFIAPSCLPRVEGLRYAPLMYDTTHVADAESALRTVLSALAVTGDVADFYCVVPIRDGKRVYDGAIRLSASTIGEMGNGVPPNWESFVPIPMPKVVEDALPALPLDDKPGMQVLPSFLGLLTTQQYVRRLTDLIADLARSSQPLDRRLHARYIERIEDVCLDLRGAARMAILKLKEAFGDDLTSDADYVSVLRFAMAVEDIHQGTTPNSTDLSAEQITVAVRSLLERRE